MRLIRVFALVALLAGVFAASASAFGFTDGSLLPPNGTVGVPYSFKLDARNGCPPYTFHLDPGGTFPPGLSFASSGWITGTPTKAGSFSWWGRVTNICPGDSSERLITITINPGAGPPAPPAPPAPAPPVQSLVVTTATLKPATVGAGYSATLGATGGSSLSWSVTGGSFPAGLSLRSNGSIDGTASATGSFTFTVSVKDGSGRTTSKQLTLTVLAPLSAATPAPVTVEVGLPFTTTLKAVGGLAPYSWAAAGAGSLPVGFTLDRATGALGGTPTRPHPISLALTATDAIGSAVNVLVQLDVKPRLAVVTFRLAAARVGYRYRARLVSRGGAAPLAWSVVRGLPRGLRLDAETGVVTGTPRKGGKTRITLKATDALGATSTKMLVLTVRV